jgi:alginate O-acetyltransferase complex protein AlgI
VVFSSLVFLYLFLPIALLGHAIAPMRLRNLWLLIASLTFYAWGELWYTWVIAASIVTNWLLGLAVHATRGHPRRGRLVVAAGITVNLGLLVWFKYANFLADNLSAVAQALGGAGLALDPIHLPIGISFFTFQAISYLVDIHRGEVKAERSLVAFGMYKSLFPQLIAGPIVRYRDVAAQIPDRRIELEAFSAGIGRFLVGLGKKALIANAVAAPADYVFSVPAGELSAGLAWYGAVCYALQIYFDFSGYSDMAIGLGRMLGFRFPENFAHPYAATSIRDFWRRWHISLSTFFRDYVYIPLGGNRQGALRSALNLSLVFLLCGFWHGASWAFVVWGAYHGLLLSLERFGGDRVLDRLPKPARWLYAMVLVLVGWVFFRCETLTHAAAFLSAMAGAGAPGNPEDWRAALDPHVAIAIAVGAIASVGAFAGFHDGVLAAWRARQAAAIEVGYQLGRLAFLALIALGSTLTLISSRFNPFIYYRF